MDMYEVPVGRQSTEVVCVSGAVVAAINRTPVLILCAVRCALVLATPARIDYCLLPALSLVGPLTWIRWTRIGGPVPLRLLNEHYSMQSKS